MVTPVPLFRRYVPCQRSRTQSGWGLRKRSYIQFLSLFMASTFMAITLVLSPEVTGNSLLKHIWPTTSSVFPGENFRPHDEPNHHWHWTRAFGLPQPRDGLKRDCQGMSYADHYRFFHTHGYTIFQSCSLNETTLGSASNYTASLTTPRESNLLHPAIRQLAVDVETREFLEFLHGGSHRVFPYQTLNFPVATQQPLHVDLIHFDTFPRAMMAAAWVALEDVGLEQGPLVVVPGSHLKGTWDFEEISLREKTTGNVTEPRVFSKFFGQELNRLVDEDPDLYKKNVKSIKYGQTLVWAAALLHGGAPLIDTKTTRLSQVTHYFFEGAEYFWVPRLSDPLHGKIQPIGSVLPCPPPLESCIDRRIQHWISGETM